MNNQVTPFIWSRSDCPFLTDNNRIDIWLLDLEDTKLHLPKMLSEDELIRAQKLIHQSDKDRFVRSRCSLRFVLGRCLKVSPKSLVFAYGEKGKPMLSPAYHTPIEFNLSHSRDKALIAVSYNRGIGIDISDVNRSSSNIAISKRSFTATEHKALLTCPAEEQARQFHRIWSQKEAYTKAIGLGYAYGFKHFTVSPEAGLISDILDKDACSQSRILAFDTGIDTASALSYKRVNEDDNPEIYYWDFNTDKISL
ncbi:MAG: 4'-phosphopantetheinyl transferase [Candidatus Azotimanducaceae bacterium]